MGEEAKENNTYLYHSALLLRNKKKTVGVKKIQNTSKGWKFIQKAIKKKIQFTFSLRDSFKHPKNVYRLF